MVAEHITSLPSSKHSGVRSRTQMIVIHSAETPLLNGYAVSVTVNWLNRLLDQNGRLIEASINTFFGPDTTVRSVHTDCAAWHASWANSLSVGYEFTGYAALSRADWLTDLGKDMLDRAGREIAADAAQYGIPLRYLTNQEVVAIANGNTSIKGIATHRQIDSVNRTDPGNGFPYDHLLSYILKHSGQNSSTTPHNKENYVSDWTADEKREVMVNIQNIRKDQVEIKSTVAEIKKRTDRYLDDKVSKIPGKVLETEFPKLGKDKAGKPYVDSKGNPLMTSVKNELGWNAANIAGQEKAHDDIKTRLNNK